MENDKRVVGAAIIGYGGIGRGWHAPNIKSIDGIELIGIYDIDPEKLELAENDGVKAYQSREELLADEKIDIIIIGTPNDVHKEIALASMDAGKNVICEKPVAMNSAELEEMIASANKNKVLFTVNQNRRWDNDYLTVRKIVENNMLGNVFNIESRVQGSRGIPADWRNCKQYGGGMIFDWGIHLLDQALIIMGDRKLKSVFATRTNITNAEVDDGFRATLNFGDINYYVEVTTSNFISLPRWYVLGENGTAVIENWQLDGKIVKVSDWENRDAVPVHAGMGLTKTMAPRTDDTIKTYPLPKPDKGESWQSFYKNVIACLNGEESAFVTHEQIRRSLKLVEAIVESSETNAVVPFEE